MIAYIRKGGVKETMQVIMDCIAISITQPRIQRLAKELYHVNPQIAAHNVWAWTKKNIRYELDPVNKEIIREASATIEDGKGDCEDMTIAQCAILSNMGYGSITRFNLVAFNGSPDSQHIFTTVGDEPNKANSLVIGTSIDTVPPLQAFDQIGEGITKNWHVTISDMDIYRKNTPNISGIGGIRGIQAIEEQAAPPDAITLQLMAAQSALMAASVAGIGTVSDSKELRKVHTLIKLNGSVERDILLPIMEYVKDISTNGNIIWKDDAPYDIIAEYIEEAFAAKDDDEAINGIGIGKLKVAAKLKAAAQKLAAKKAAIKKNPQPKQSKPKILASIKKVLHVIVKVNPATIAARNGFYLFLKLNLFHFAGKLALGYLTESEARARKLNMTIWAKLRDKVAELEKFIYTIGGEAANFKKHVLQGAALGAKNKAKRNDKKGVKGVGAFLADDAAVLITALTPIGIAFVKMKGVDMNNIQTDPTDPSYDASLGTEFDASNLTPSGIKEMLAGTLTNLVPTALQQGFNSDAEVRQAENGVFTENPSQPNRTDTDPPVDPPKPGDTNTKKDNTLLYVAGAAIGLFVVGKATKMF